MNELLLVVSSLVVGVALGWAFAQLNDARVWIARMFEDASGVPDDARVGAFVMVLGFVGSSVWSVAVGNEFKPQDWGIGAGALLAGVGGLFGLRKDN